jgi:cysteine synthase
VVEATSGNTGIALAMVCAQKGYPLVVVMAENFSIERRRLMRFLGAKVILTPASEKGSGMLGKARELAETHGWFLARQFKNEAGPDIHSATTAREILADFGGTGPDYWVSGFGSGGTLKGVARVLRAESPTTRVVAVEPDNAPLLGSGIAQAYLPDGAPAASHPSFRPHLMQGWSPDFVPRLAADAMEAGLIDEIRPVAGAAALGCARQLAQREGILCGITGGATFATALDIARTAPRGARILAMLPDTGERYLSTPLFADAPEAMTDEETAIAASTPRFRFDSRPAASAPATAPIPVAPAAAMRHVAEILADPEDPVVMFALEWCEFCWSVRKLFAAAGVSYRSVDLDTATYRKDDFGGDVRAALAAMTGAATIPQVFVGGKHIGGATETFAAFDSGEMSRMIGMPSRPVGRAADFLPAWLHPRGVSETPTPAPSASEAGFRSGSVLALPPHEPADGEGRSRVLGSRQSSGTGGVTGSTPPGVRFGVAQADTNETPHTPIGHTRGACRAHRSADQGSCSILDRRGR